MIFCTAMVIVASANCLHAQQVIINELLNTSSNTDEWIELLVVQDNLDMRSWNLRDYSSGGTAQAPLVFTTNSLWSALRAGTIIIVGSTAATFQEDTDPSDYLLMIKSNNATYFTGTVFVFAGSSDAIQIRNGGNTHVIGVSWGSSNAASLPSPKVHFTSSSTSGTSISFSGDSLTQLTNTSKWVINNASPTLGTGNTATNSTWIAGLRGQAQGDGTGSGRIQPDTLNGGTLGSIHVTYSRNVSFNVNAFRFIVPPSFAWSHNRSDVSYTNITATDTVIGDTVYLSNIVFNADSTVVTIANITAPDSTAIYLWKLQSRQSTYADVTPVPRITVFGPPIPIAEVKVNDANGTPFKLGALVTIEGIVTVANEFGGPSFVQDNSAGIGIFGSTFSTAVNIGDEVKVSGVVSPFNGLCELTSPVLHGIVSSGNTVTPLLSLCSQLFNDGQGGVEQYEGLLVRVNLVSVLDTVSGNPPTTWNSCGLSSGCNYRLSDASGHVDIRADNGVSFFNSPAPQGVFSVIGVLSQFKATPPYIGGYQLMPRVTGDLLTSGPIIATTPVETNIQQTSLTITWTTINSGTARIRYGATPALELGLVSPDDSLRTVHAIGLSGLSPATSYYVQAFSVAGPDTSIASTIIVGTSSPAGSTGQINVYFNKSVNTNLAWIQPALGNQDFVSRLIPRIDNARRSIDVALYSLSGTPGATIASALVNAKNRGVKVRVICEYDNRSTAPFNTLVGNSVPLIDDRFDPINDGAGLMHNKFFVFEARGNAPESVWVVAGSWNPTDPGTNSDYQNVVEIQDVALSNAYTTEFNEMWGSNTDVPNASASRFGARKTDNTPHRFVIGGRSIQSYFSPSDRVTSKIISTLNTADHSIGFELLTFTRTDISSVIVAKKNAGRKVRGNMDNNTDLGTQYDYLIANNIDVRLKTGSGLLHHKYAIVDAEDPAWNGTTITGSHNWSSSAENSNNENTLIIRDANITNQFLQEFAARYYQFGGTDSIVVGVEDGMNGAPNAFSLSQNYPNPFNPSTTISYEVPVKGMVVLSVFNVLGQEVITLVNHEQNIGRYTVELSAPHLASGVYFYRINVQPAAEGPGHSWVSVRKMLMLK